MAGSANKVILVGNLGRDPEVRTLPSGDRVVSFSLATTESWRDKNTGERKDRTEWRSISIFNENLGKLAEQYCRKGSKIYLEGQLATREYTDKDGNQRKATDVVLQRFRGELTLARQQRRPQRRQRLRLPERWRRRQFRALVVNGSLRRRKTSSADGRRASLQPVGRRHSVLIVASAGSATVVLSGIVGRAMCDIKDRRVVAGLTDRCFAERRAAEKQPLSS
jgi:single stranded DNA-binding protein